MPYNLRPRSFQRELVEDVEINDPIGGDSSDIEDHVSEYSESSDFSMDENDSDLENVTLNERIVQSRARGRPATVLRGVDGYKWKTQKPTRESSK